MRIVEDRLARSQAQGGQSLVEVIVAIVLFSSVILAISAGMFTINRTTVSNERVQTVDAALVFYGEVLRGSIGYRECRPGFNPSTADSSDPNPAYVADRSLDPNAGYMQVANSFTELASATQIEGWLRPPAVVPEVIFNGLESWNPETEEFEPGCALPDTGVQLIRYQVTYTPGAMSPPRPGDPITREGEIVKRKGEPS